MNKKIAVVAIAIAGVGAFALAAKAQPGQANDSVKTAKQERIAQMETKKTERLELRAANKERMQAERCQKVESRVSTRLNRYENNGSMLQKVYDHMLTRLNRLADRLTTAGADTTKLKTDIASLKVLIDKLYADQKTFVEGLKTTQNFACGNSEGEFVGKLGEARKILPLIKSDRAAIKNFFQTTIKADLKAIRTELAKKKTSTETTQEKPETENEQTEKAASSAPTL